MMYATKWSAACFAAVFLIACGNEPGDTTERVNEKMNEAQREITKADDTQEWMNERNEARRELNNLRERLVEKRARIEERLAKGEKNTKKRAELETLVAELNTNIARLEGQVPVMDNSTATDWDRVRNDARVVRDSTTNWFERQAELIDQKTDADADKDGH